MQSQGFELINKPNHKGKWKNIDPVFINTKFKHIKGINIFLYGHNQTFEYTTS